MEYECVAKEHTLHYDSILESTRFPTVVCEIVDSYLNLPTLRCDAMRVIEEEIATVPLYNIVDGRIASIHRLRSLVQDGKLPRELRRRSGKTMACSMLPLIYALTKRLHNGTEFVVVTLEWQTAYLHLTSLASKKNVSVESTHVTKRSVTIKLQLSEGMGIKVVYRGYETRVHPRQFLIRDDRLGLIRDSRRGGIRVVAPRRPYYFSSKAQAKRIRVKRRTELEMLAI